MTWSEIETSDNVFDWSDLDDRIPYFDALGQDIYFQIYGCPLSARIAGQGWAAVPDQGGIVGAGCVPDTGKLVRFVKALLTRYPQIKYLSPWNEPKWDNPVVRFTGTLTGTLNAGDVVTGLASGAEAVVMSCTATSLVVRATESAATATPFANIETIQVDASHRFAATQQAAVSYWFGTKAQLAMHCQAVHAAAKAVRSSIVITTPDFVEGANISGEEEWLATWLDAGGNGTFDVLAYHFYNYDIRPDNSYGKAYSLQLRCDAIDAILSARGISVPKIASECGNTPGWAYYMAWSKEVQAQNLKRVSAYLAMRGWIGVAWYGHSNAYSGNPSAYPEIAQALNWLGVNIAGRTISGAYIDSDQTLRMLVDGVPVVL